MKSAVKEIKKQMEKHRRLMKDKKRHYTETQVSYGVFKGLELALKILNEVSENKLYTAVSGSLPLASDEEIQKYVTDRFSGNHLLPEIIAFRAIKYYQQGMPPVSGRECCLDESEGKQ